MAEPDDSDDAELARLAAGGCLESFASIATRYQVRIVHYVRQILGSGERGHADDIAQEVFVRAWRSLATYDDRWAFSTWLFTIVRRTCLNHARATRRRQQRELIFVSTPGSEADPATEAVAVDAAAKLWDVAAAALSEQQFTALWLRYVEAKSIPDIAAVLSTADANVKVILFRARRRLAPLVRDLVD